MCQVRDAVKRVLEGESAIDYDHIVGQDRTEAVEWLQELEVQTRAMEQVKAPSCKNCAFCSVGSLQSAGGSA